MRSIPLVMTWDMLRRGRWSLGFLVLAANAFPFLLLGALKHDGAIEPGDLASVMLHALMIEINLLMFGVAVFSAIGPPTRLYTFPIRTSSLVLVLMLQAIVAVAAELVVSTVLLNLAFGLQWPLWGPVLFAAALCASILAVQWLFEKSGWVIVAMTLTMAALSLWLIWHEGIWLIWHGRALFGKPTQIWSVVTPGDLLTLGLTLVAAYAVAVVGVSRNRCGMPPISIGFVAWFNRSFSAATPEIGRPFRTPVRAQLWFEWRKKGWAMPVTVVMGLFMGLVVWLIHSRDVRKLYEGLFAVGAFVPIAGFLSGFLTGQVSNRDPEFRISQLLATRPITSTDLARSILKCAAASLVVAWATWAAAFLVLGRILWMSQVDFSSRIPQPLGGWWYFPATLIGAWAASGLTTPLVLTGRKTLVAATVMGSIVLAVGVMLFSKFALARDAQELLFQAALGFCGIALVLGTLAAFFTAHQRALIGAAALWTAAIAWGVLCALLGVHWISHPAVPLHFELLAAGILALAVSPWATAPLALAWNRNR